MALISKGRTRNNEVPVEAVLSLYQREMPEWKWRIDRQSKKSAAFLIEGKKGFRRLSIMRDKKGRFAITRDHGLIFTFLTLGVLYVLSEFNPFPKYLVKAQTIARDHLDLENYDEKALAVE